MVTVNDRAITTIDRALGAWSETSRGLWAQAGSRVASVVNEIDHERRQYAAKVSALEARQRATRGTVDSEIESQLAIVRLTLLSVDRALDEAKDAWSVFASARRRSIQNLDPAVSEARADLGRRLGTLDAYATATAGMGSPSTGRASSPTGNPSTTKASRGLQDVDLAAIDFFDNPVNGEFGKGGATLADYRWAVETWESVVRPGIQRNMSRDDFAERDTARGANPLRRTADVYDLFLGDTDQIVLSRRPDGRYDVVNGRHRIVVARQLGITTLPGRIVS